MYDCGKIHLRLDGKPGGQCLTTPESTIDMHFDGFKCYFHIQKPTAEDMQKYEVIELTSSQPYEPRIRRFSRHAPRRKARDVNDWSAKLGFPTVEVTEATLSNTTQMVQTLQAETREYMRDHYKLGYGRLDQDVSMTHVIMILSFRQQFQSKDINASRCSHLNDPSSMRSN